MNATDYDYSSAPYLYAYERVEEPSCSMRWDDPTIFPAANPSLVTFVF